MKAPKYQAEMVQALLEHGSLAAYTENANGESPMDVAQRRSLRSVIAILIKQKQKHA